jgi:plasmid maintenance system antidote protein VapI
MTTPTEDTSSGDALIAHVMDQVEEAMNRRGITRRELSGLLDVTPGYVSHLLVHRNRNLTIQSVVKLAEVFGCTVDIRFIDPLEGKVEAGTSVEPEAPAMAVPTDD